LAHHFSIQEFIMSVAAYDIEIHNPNAGRESLLDHLENLSAAELVTHLNAHIDKALLVRVHGKPSAVDCELLDRWQARSGKQLTPW
jgi:hypothetical protein